MIARGLPASYGSICGKVVLSCQDAIFCREKGIPSILCLPEASLDYLDGIEAADGVITHKGGISSHVAVWLREAGKPAVFGAKQLVVDRTSRLIMVVGSPFRIAEGDYITIDGSTGMVFAGEIETVESKQDEDYLEIMKWAKLNRSQIVFANVTTPQEVIAAMEMGADGYVYPTEHLFFSPGIIDLTRLILLTDSESDRAAALAKLQEEQKIRMLHIFRQVGDSCITVSLFNESLSQCISEIMQSDSQNELEALKAKLRLNEADLVDLISKYAETNPAMGFRGSRVSLVLPYITTMQVKAIVGATIAARREGISVKVKLQLPIVFTDQELIRIVPLVKQAVSEVCAETVTDFVDFSQSFDMGVVVSCPRACFLSDKIANLPEVDFITFDMNDLTQFVFALDAKVANLFMKNFYIGNQVLPRDPFIHIDEGGVMELVKIAITKARKSKLTTKVSAVLYTMEYSRLKKVNFLLMDTYLI